MTHKGVRRERQLANSLDERDFAVMRAPASGSATDRDLPDVLAGNGTAFYAIECKASGGDPIYLGDDEIEGLGRFATAFGAQPLIGVRFDYCDWSFFSPTEIITENGAYRVKQERLELGLRIEDL